MQALLAAIASLQQPPTEAGRLFHGRGGLYPGCEHLVLDAYPPCLLLTSFELALGDDELAAVHEALSRRWAQIAPGEPLNWVYQGRQVGSEERPTARVMAGAVPDPHIVREGEAQYLVHLLKGQNHGLFLDMAEGRRWVREQVEASLAGTAGTRLKVLNLFAYSCAFSVVALQAGAEQVVNVDMSAGALATGRRNHQLNGETEGAVFLAHDIFKSWGKLTRMGPYGLVIVDPPSFQKGSFVATKDYARLMRRLPDLLAPGGQALLCLNAPRLSSSFLTEQMQELVPELQFVRRLANPPSFADIDEERALKVLIYRAPTA